MQLTKELLSNCESIEWQVHPCSCVNEIEPAPRSHGYVHPFSFSCIVQWGKTFEFFVFQALSESIFCNLKVDELDKTIIVAANDPTSYGVDELELEKRRRWTSTARTQVRIFQSCYLYNAKRAWKFLYTVPSKSGICCFIGRSCEKSSSSWEGTTEFLRQYQCQWDAARATEGSRFSPDRQIQSLSRQWWLHRIRVGQTVADYEVWSLFSLYLFEVLYTVLINQTINNMLEAWIPMQLLQYVYGISLNLPGSLQFSFTLMEISYLFPLV